MFTARELNAVDGRARLYGGVVCGRKWAGEEGIKEGGFSGACGTEYIGEEDVALGFGVPLAATGAFSWFGEVKSGGCIVVRWIVA